MSVYIGGFLVSCSSVALWPHQSKFLNFFVIMATKLNQPNFCFSLVFWIEKCSLKRLNQHGSINTFALGRKHTGKHAHTHTPHSGMQYFSKLIIFSKKWKCSALEETWNQMPIFPFSPSLHCSLTSYLSIHLFLPQWVYNITLPLPVCIMPVRHTAI